MREGGSTYATLLYLYSLQLSCSLHKQIGHKEDADRWHKTAARLNHAAKSAWSEKRGVFVERPAYPDLPVSQHTQAMAILSGAASGRQQKAMIKAIQNGVPAAKMTLQQGLPFAEALQEAGRFDVAVKQFMPEYRAMLDLHLTTWLESTGPGVRSDCHAWSAWPPYVFLTKVLGIAPMEAGFERIAIRPTPVFPDASGTMPTPKGDVSVTWRKEGKHFILEGASPVGVPTHLRLPDGTKHTLSGGGPFAVRG